MNTLYVDYILYSHCMIYQNYHKETGTKCWWNQMLC